ncbi:unnamed protein product, partial [Allacma fusca]
LYLCLPVTVSPPLGTNLSTLVGPGIGNICIIFSIANTSPQQEIN